MDYFIGSDGELYHWGIKGQKWGQRRYQNKDGSLTPAGRKRYNQEVEALKAREKVIKNREREVARRAKLDAKKADLDAREAALNGGDKKSDSDKKSRAEHKAEKAAANKPKSIADMTDDELNDAINRARMENTYKQLRPEPVVKPSFGKQMIDSLTPVLIENGKTAVKSFVDKAVKDVLKDKVDPNSLAGIEAANAKLAAQLRNKLLKEGFDIDAKGDNVKAWESFDKYRKGLEEADRQRKEQAEAEKKAKKEAAEADKQSAKQAKKDAKEQAKKEAEERWNREHDSDINPPDAEYEPINQKTGYDFNPSKEKHNATASRGNWHDSKYYQSVEDYLKNDSKATAEDGPSRSVKSSAGNSKNDPKITVEDGPSRSAKSSADNSKKRDLPIVDADISSDKQMTRYSPNTSLSVVSKAHADSGRDYVDAVDWGSLNYSGKSSSGNTKIHNADYDVEDLLRRNGEALDSWYERMKRSGLI